MNIRFQEGPVGTEAPLLSFAESAVAAGDRARPLAVSLPLGGCVPSELFGSDATEGFFWGDREGAGLAGLGAAAVLSEPVTSGAAGDRFARVREAARGVLENLVIRFPGDTPPPSPRFFGGFSFTAGEADGREWAGLGDARFVLPELSCSVTGEVGWVTLFLPGGREAASESAALARLEAALERLGAGAAGAVGTSREGTVPSPNGVRGADDDRAYRELVAAALKRIEAGDLEKVVVARRTSTSWAGGGLRAVANALGEAAGTFRFAVSTGDRVFLGATPERLVSVSGRAVRTEAVAGTSGEGDDRGGPLDRRTKDLWEHELVVRAISDSLRPVCDLRREAAPSIRSIGRVRHLATPFEGELRGEGHVLDLVRRLHPTPAVGGWPTRAAVRWITENEPFPRGWYAGPIGWFDGAGDGEFAVALRCGLAYDGRLDLYAGSGVVAGSDPQAEYEETRMKLRALPELLGLV